MALGDPALALPAVPYADGDFEQLRGVLLLDPTCRLPGLVFGTLGGESFGPAGSDGLARRQRRVQVEGHGLLARAGEVQPSLGPEVLPRGVVVGLGRGGFVFETPEIDASASDEDLGPPTPRTRVEVHALVPRRGGAAGDDSPLVAAALALDTLLVTRGFWHRNRHRD